MVPFVSFVTVLSIAVTIAIAPIVSAGPLVLRVSWMSQASPVQLVSMLALASMLARLSGVACLSGPTFVVVVVVVVPVPASVALIAFALVPGPPVAPPVELQIGQGIEATDGRHAHIRVAGIDGCALRVRVRNRLRPELVQRIASATRPRAPPFAAPRGRAPLRLVRASVPALTGGTHEVVERSLQGVPFDGLGHELVRAEVQDVGKVSDVLPDPPDDHDRHRRAPAAAAYVADRHVEICIPGAGDHAITPLTQHHAPHQFTRWAAIHAVPGREDGSLEVRVTARVPDDEQHRRHGL
jgi:hypothetical protein